MTRVLLLLVALSPADAQSFEVASIKFHPEPVTHMRDPAIRGAHVTGEASTLMDMIETAYGLRGDQITGAPKWATSDHYDLDAKPPGEGPITRAEMQQMLQALLADRFQLKVHQKSEEVPMYGLVVAKNGPRLKAAGPDAKGGMAVVASDKGLHMEATRTSMEQLARQLCVTAGRPVVDQTGLAGFYVFTMDWWPANRDQPADSTLPSMIEALKDLGLRLDPTTGLQEKLVIDRAEKPTEN